MELKVEDKLLPKVWVILKSKYGNKHLYYLLDLSDTNKLADNVKKIREENRDIDILINNAGIAKDNLLLRMNKEQWQDVIDINLSSNFKDPSLIRSKAIIVVIIFVIDAG